MVRRLKKKATADKQNDSGLGSKSSKLHVQTDTVPSNGPVSDTHKEVNVRCKHFSIRGYVSEVRKNNPKRCFPFTMKNSTEPVYSELPPMEVRDSMWKLCPYAGEASGSGNQEPQKPEENADDASLALAGEFSQLNVCREQNGEASASTTDLNNTISGLNIVDGDPKGKGKALVTIEPAGVPSAFDNGFLWRTTDRVEVGSCAGKQAFNNGFLWHTTERMEAGSSSGKQVIELGSNSHGNGLIKALQKDSREHHIETGLAQGSVYRNGEYGNESCKEKSQDSSHDELADAQTNAVRAELVGIVNGPTNDFRSRLLNLPDLNECSGEPLNEENNDAIINDPSPISNEVMIHTANEALINPPNCDEAMFEKPISNDAMINTPVSNDNNIDSNDDDDYLGVECRKIAKTKTMVELLETTKRIDNSQPANGKRQRIGSQEEGLKSTEIRVSDRGNKKLRRTTESTESASEYASDSDDISTEIIPKTLAKRRCRSRIPLVEKKIKKSTVDPCDSSSYRPRILAKSTARAKGKTSENILPESVVPDKLIKRSLVTTKKRGRLSQASKEGSSLNICKSQVPKDSAATQKDESAEKRSNRKFKKDSENDLHISRSSVDCQASVNPVEHGIRLALTQPEPMLVDGESSRKHQENRNKGGETSVALRPTAVGANSTVDSFDEDGHGERDFDPKTNIEDKSTGVHEAEEGSCLAQVTCFQASSSVANRNEQTMRMDIDINSIPIDDKATNDIPMDIVELMAKNQYERNLNDPKEMALYPATPEVPRNFSRDNGINGSYGEYWPKFSESYFHTVPKSPSNTDPRNSIGHGNSGYFSDYNRNYPSLECSRPRENTASASFLPNQGQENSAPCPPYGLTLSNGSGNLHRASPQRYPPSYLHGTESYRLLACAPRQNTTEASRSWSSVVTSHMPLGITNQQMISQNSSVLGVGSFGHYQASGSVLTFNTSGSSSLRNQQNLNFSNGCNSVGGLSEGSGGSVGMYSDDVVSAMHLLSMMQTATRIQKVAALSLGPSQNVVGPSSSREPFVADRGRSFSLQDNAGHPSYPTTIPSARPFAASFQSGGIVGRISNNGFVGPIPLTSHGQRNMESSHFILPGGDHCPQRRFMGASPLENRTDISAIASPSSVSPLQVMKDAVPNFRSRIVIREERSKSPTPEKMPCILNQNPSEFNDMKELSRYMIGADDLRPRRAARGRPVQIRGGSKRQEGRMNKSTHVSAKDRGKQKML